MKKNIQIDSGVLSAIANSIQITDTEKMNFLKVVNYMTPSEKRELISII